MKIFFANALALFILVACDDKNSYDKQPNAANIVEKFHAEHQLVALVPIIIYNKDDVDKDSVLVCKVLHGKAYELTAKFKNGRYNLLNYNYFKVLAAENNISYSMNLSAFQSNSKILLSDMHENKDTILFAINKDVLTTSYRQSQLGYEITYRLRNHFIKNGVGYDTIMLERHFLYAAPKKSFQRH